MSGLQNNKYYIIADVRESYGLNCAPPPYFKKESVWCKHLLNKKVKYLKDSNMFGHVRIIDETNGQIYSLFGWRLKPVDSVDIYSAGF